MMHRNKISNVLRDGKWNEDDSAFLVIRDIISVKFGDILPDDAHLLDGDPLKIDYVLVTIIILWR